jgi:hypothetical protein
VTSRNIERSRRCRRRRGPRPRESRQRPEDHVHPGSSAWCQNPQPTIVIGDCTPARELAAARRVGEPPRDPGLRRRDVLTPAHTSQGGTPPPLAPVLDGVGLAAAVSFRRGVHRPDFVYIHTDRSSRRLELTRPVVAQADLSARLLLVTPVPRNRPAGLAVAPELLHARVSGFHVARRNLCHIDVARIHLARVVHMGPIELCLERRAIGQRPDALVHGRASWARLRLRRLVASPRASARRSATREQRRHEQRDAADVLIAQSLPRQQEGRSYGD